MSREAPLTSVLLPGAILAAAAVILCYCIFLPTQRESKLKANWAGPVNQGWPVNKIRDQKAESFEKAKNTPLEAEFFSYHEGPSHWPLNR